MRVGADGADVKAGGGGGAPAATALPGVVIVAEKCGSGGDATAECMPAGVGRGGRGQTAGEEVVEGMAGEAIKEGGGER